MSVRIAMAQLGQHHDESKQARVKRVAELVATGPEADLVVLPELWDVGYFGFGRYATDAEPLDAPGSPATVLAKLARARRITIVGGSVLERDGDRLRNTTVVLGPDGALLGRYRKHHLFAYRSQEAALLTPGPGPKVVDTPVGRLGLATCFDLRFPTHFAALRALGADLFVVPAAWPQARVEHWRVLCRARAIETQTPLVAVNMAGVADGVDVAGCSCALDAHGTVLAEAGRKPGWFVATVAHEATAAWRREFPLDSQVVVGS